MFVFGFCPNVGISLVLQGYEPEEMGRGKTGKRIERTREEDIRKRKGRRKRETIQ